MRGGADRLMRSAVVMGMLAACNAPARGPAAGERSTRAAATSGAGTASGTAGTASGTAGTASGTSGTSGNAGTASGTAATGAVAWRDAPTVGVRIEVPGDARIEATAGNVFISNGRFMLNLFAVDAYSAATAAEQKARLENTLGSVTFTTHRMGTETWRFDYALPGGKAGTISRIHPGRPLDCGVHGVPPAVAAAVATACAAVRPL